MAFCRRCQGHIRHDDDSLGNYCRKKCRNEAAMALLEAAEQAEQVAVASGNPVDVRAAVVEEYARVMAESAGDEPAALAAKLVGAVLGRTVLSRFTQAGGFARGPRPNRDAPPSWGAAPDSDPSSQREPQRERRRPPPQPAAQEQLRDQPGPRPPPPRPSPRQPPPRPAPQQQPRRVPTEREKLLQRLSLGADATWADVEDKFRFLAQRLHPDICGGDGKPMKELNATKARLRELMGA